MNYEETKNTMQRYILARIPFISFDTVEKDRAVDILKKISNEINMQMSIHSMSKGLIDLNSGTILTDEKTIIGTLDYISNSLKTKENQTYILSDVSELETDTITARYLADIINMAESKSSSIIAITDQGIWPLLQRLGMNVALDFPSEEEMLNIIVDTIKPYKNSINIEWTSNDYKEIATILLGISKAEAKNVISTLIAKGSLEKSDLIDLKFAKDSLFSNINGLEKIKVEENLVYGGLENLKDWLGDKKKLLDPSKRGMMKERGIKSPRGILIMGVPGCGKSLTAKAVAKDWEMPLYLLDFSTIQGRYVGQSEQQLKEALETAEHVSPCILWIDEIEKGLAGASDSSGVTNRLIGQFLYWLQECRKEVFVITTANNLKDLPPEFLRKGRFDEIFFVDLPNKKERAEIISLYIEKYLSVRANNESINKWVNLCENFSGADIESVIREIAYKVVSDNIQITEELISSYFIKTVSTYKTNSNKIDIIREWANGRTINASKPLTNTTISETI